MSYSDTLTRQRLIEFLSRLIESYDRKIFLLLDKSSSRQDGFQSVKIKLNCSFFRRILRNYLNNMLKKNVHSGDLPHTEKQLEHKAKDFMNCISHQPEKISNLFLHKNLFPMESAFVA